MILQDLEMTEYRQRPGLSKHELDAFSVAPSYYKWKKSQDFKPSRSMELGTMVHSLALEKRKEFAVGPQVDRRTTAGKAEWAAFCADNIGKLIVTQEENAQIIGAVEAVLPLLNQIKISSVEASMFWERDGVACKGRPDIIGESRDSKVIVDLKTVTGIAGFDSSFFRFRYDVQAEWYLHGINAITNAQHKFVFLVVDMEPPHLTQFVIPSSMLLDEATQRVDDELRAFKDCLESDVWPGMPETRIIMPRFS